MTEIECAFDLKDIPRDGFDGASLEIPPAANSLCGPNAGPQDRPAHLEGFRTAPSAGAAFPSDGIFIDESGRRVSWSTTQGPESGIGASAHVHETVDSGDQRREEGKGYSTRRRSSDARTLRATSLSACEMTARFINSSIDSEGKRQEEIKKKRTRTTPDQLRILQRAFQADPMPNSSARLTLAKKLGMNVRAVQVWFQNRRAKGKLDQKRMERDPESRLRDENHCGEEYVMDEYAHQTFAAMRYADHAMRSNSVPSDRYSLGTSNMRSFDSFYCPETFECKLKRAVDGSLVVEDDELIGSGMGGMSVSMENLRIASQALCDFSESSTDFFADQSYAQTLCGGMAYGENGQFIMPPKQVQPSYPPYGALSGDRFDVGNLVAEPHQHGTRAACFSECLTSSDGSKPFRADDDVGDTPVSSGYSEPEAIGHQMHPQLGGYVYPHHASFSFGSEAYTQGSGMGLCYGYLPARSSPYGGYQNSQYSDSYCDPAYIACPSTSPVDGHQYPDVTYGADSQQAGMGASCSFPNNAFYMPPNHFRRCYSSPDVHAFLDNRQIMQLSRGNSHLNGIPERDEDDPPKRNCSSNANAECAQENKGQNEHALGDENDTDETQAANSRAERSASDDASEIHRAKNSRGRPKRRPTN